MSSTTKKKEKEEDPVAVLEDMVHLKKKVDVLGELRVALTADPIRKNTLVALYGRVAQLALFDLEMEEIRIELGIRILSLHHDKKGT